MNEIVTVFIEYTEINGGKKRPALVYQRNEESLILLRITSHFENKSAKIKKQYYHIDKWEQANLAKESWIDVGSTETFPAHGLNLKVIGQLSLLDKVGLSKFIENFYHQ
ncbi:hypothetical protein [Secundilactobacillus malefermentans]|uniref:Toxin-antitoxin system, toxin component, MazF family n=2 Tax=Secundilactobacillus malefermentans TaxID=176292 RepID=A0A4R5NS09_9LACO|nr:hypothetical protein [Secundilactobacillus malefermentans]QEA31746.1 hypothetical protein FGL90_05865 [Secundilactobacillus malefermentans]TDG79909.1 hypothetical protein C5L31_002128 [Secundilactobacillus malefermentans]